MPEITAKHGSLYRYNKFGCRCNQCRARKSEQDAKYRQRQADKVTAERIGYKILPATAFNAPTITDPFGRPVEYITAVDRNPEKFVPDPFEQLKAAANAIDATLDAIYTEYPTLLT